MINVLEFPKPAIIAGKAVKEPQSRAEYLRIIKRFLTEEDYHDVCVAILDEDYYEVIEEDLAKIVNSYYTF